MKAWIGVACREHVMRGITGGFGQLCHGRAAPLRAMKQGDWIAYYSPTEMFGSKQPLQAFTALGQLQDDETFQFDMGGGFVPFRRRIKFLDVSPVVARPLLPELDFVKRHPNWGMLMRRGHFEITLSDIQRISRAMGVELKTAPGLSLPAPKRAQSPRLPRRKTAPTG